MINHRPEFFEFLKDKGIRKKAVYLASEYKKAKPFAIEYAEYHGISHHLAMVMLVEYLLSGLRR